MATFPSLIQTLRTNRQAGTSSLGLDQLFGMPQRDLNLLSPTQNEVLGFLDEYEKIVSSENKSPEKKQDRINAIRLIEGYCRMPGALVFDGIEPYRFAFQLAIRVREPRFINQDQYGVCGPAALVMAFAKNNPSRFANYGIDMISTGSGHYMDQLIEAPDKVKKGYFWPDMAQADYVLVAPIAVSEGLLVDNSLQTALQKGATFPQVKAWLQRAGYKNVEEHIMLFPELHMGSSMAGHIGKAEQAIRDGRLVVLSINADLADLMLADKRRAIMDAKANAPGAVPQLIRKSGSGNVDLAKNPAASMLTTKPRTNHWVLATKLTRNGNLIDVKLYTWGTNLRRTLDLAKFATYYDGFICADYR